MSQVSVCGCVLSDNLMPSVLVRWEKSVLHLLCNNHLIPVFKLINVTLSPLFILLSALA